MLELSKLQKEVLNSDGPLLVTGGPGSGKTTVSILKAAQIIEKRLHSQQKVLFLSFARPTVARVVEAIDQEETIARETKKRIEVDTYHSFCWKLLKTHGYLIGLPRQLQVLVPSAAAVALSSLRLEYGTDLDEIQTAEKIDREHQELERLAREEGRVCFDLFPLYAAQLLQGSAKLRALYATAYPAIILDEFQDTNVDQWRLVESLGERALLIALADPEQRIFDWLGADPERLNQLVQKFGSKEIDLGSANHRSKGTDIATFGDHILSGKFELAQYAGVTVQLYDPNENQAFSTLRIATMQARKRLINAGIRDWSLAVIVPTKKMTRIVSDKFRNLVPNISHTAIVDMEPIVLSAEIIAFLLQQDGAKALDRLVELLGDFFKGKNGDDPKKSNIDEALSIRAALVAAQAKIEAGKQVAQNSKILPVSAAMRQALELVLTGDPDIDWIAIRSVLENCDCPRLKKVAEEARNLRLLDRGSELRQALALEWRTFGSYKNALAITRIAFIQEHFASSNRPESGVVVVNMHKVKGKQFDEVIIFEGWPIVAKGKLVANINRIVRRNSKDGTASELSQARQNFRVSITRARRQTTILTPKSDPCILLT